jgi:hypothetical protein
MSKRLKTVKIKSRRAIWAFEKADGRRLREMHLASKYMGF